jgi:hypothetical protein
MADIKEQEKLIEILKFTPCTYTIQMWGYGGEYVMGTVDREIYDYFKHRRLSLSDFAWDSDYADENEIPEEMCPFPPGSWYECDNIGHVNGVDRMAGTLQICDQNGNVVYERELENISGGLDENDNPEPEWSCGDEIWIDAKPAGTVVFIGSSSEKGTFFEGEIELTSPLDIGKITLCYDEIDGNEIISSVSYGDDDIDNNGGSTTGKSSDFGFYIAGSNTDGKWERYKDMDDIKYPMTEWFPAKVNPTRVGEYNTKTSDGYEYRAKWTGETWTKLWGEPPEQVKVKQWQGLAIDPDL